MTSTERRTLLFGVLVIGGAWLGLHALPAGLHRWNAGRERFIERERVLTETRRMLETLPLLEDSARVLTRAVASVGNQILSATDAPLAQNELAGRLRLIAARHGVMVLGASPVPDSTAAGQLRRVRASISLECDFRGLSEIMAALLRESVVIVTEHLSASATDPWADAATPERLQVELRLSAWYLTETSHS